MYQNLSSLRFFFTLIIIILQYFQSIQNFQYLLIHPYIIPQTKDHLNY